MEEKEKKATEPVSKAASKSAESKSHLTELAKAFAALKRPTSAEINKFRDMFYVLILRTDATERREMSHTLSRGAFTPRTVALYFAMENIEIAAPMLLFSPVLSSADLCQIILKSSLQHAKHIAQRNDLEITAVGALLKADKGSGRLRAFINQNANLNKRSDVRALLASPVRVDLPEEEPASPAEPAPAQEVAELAKDRVKSFMKPDPEPASAKPSLKKDLSDRLLNVARLSKEAKRKDVTGPEEADKAPKPLAKELLKLSRARDIKGVSAEIAKHSGMKADNVWNILTSNNTGMVASLFCALGISNSNASKLLLLLNSNVGRNAMVFRTIMRKYAMLSRQECQSYFEKMGASFGPPSEPAKKPLQHIGHFSAAIAERRRDISQSVQRGEENEQYEEKKSA